MRVLVAACAAETVVKNSRFLAEAIPIRSQAEAREKLHGQKSRYADATHVVHAFVAGPGAEVSGMSDDGEPSGTAGRPVLDVLKGSGMTNVLLTVTRWFGGTLLGTGGLVHAYSDAAKLVLSQCTTEELVRRTRFSFCADYAQYEAIRRRLGEFHVSDVDESFGSAIAVSGAVWSSEADGLCRMVQDLTRGKSCMRFVDDDGDAICNPKEVYE